MIYFVINIPTMIGIVHWLVLAPSEDRHIFEDANELAQHHHHIEGIGCLCATSTPGLNCWPQSSWPGFDGQRWTQEEQRIPRCSEVRGQWPGPAMKYLVRSYIVLMILYADTHHLCVWMCKDVSCPKQLCRKVSVNGTWIQELPASGWHSHSNYWSYHREYAANGSVPAVVIYSWPQLFHSPSVAGVHTCMRTYMIVVRKSDD